MNKYVLVMAAACFLPFDLNANGYAGINLGVNSVGINKSLVYPLESTPPTYASYRSSYSNFHGQVLVGYAIQILSKMSAAIEANADVFTGKAQYTINHWFLSNNAIAQEHLEYGAALFFLPAYQLNQYVRFFIGPGVSRSKLVIQSDWTGGNVGVTGHSSHWLNGGGFKAGIATRLTENTEIQFTYQYTQYNSVSLMNVEPLSEDSLSGRYKPAVNTVMVGIKADIPD